MAPEVEITDAEDLALWNAAAALSNSFNAVIQTVRKQTGGELLTEVVVRALALHIFGVRAAYGITAAAFEERIAAMPAPFRERLLVLGLRATKPEVKG